MPRQSFIPFLLKNQRLSKMTFLSQVTWILPIILSSASFCLAGLDATYEWKYIDYVWKCDAKKAAAVSDGIYDHTKIIPYDIQPLSDGRILVTTPRYYENPASLSTISTETGEGGPLLAPYPDWSWHTKTDCSGITSVNRVFLDDYNRLWLVDSGKIGNEQVCSPKILAFDATTDKLLIDVEIPLDLSHNADDESQGRLEIQIVETSTDSEDTFWVYVTDVEGFGLIIWDGSDIWRLNNEVFLPDPDYTTFTIGGDNVTLNLGPSSFLLTPDGFLETPALLFKPVSSVRTYAAHLEDLHNSKSGTVVPFLRLEFIGPTQELGRTFSKNGGIMLAGFAGEFFACWNMQTDALETENIGFLDTNSTTLQYINSVKTLNDALSEKLYGLSTRVQKFILGTMDFSEVNFRMLTADVPALVSGTVCEPTDSFEIEESIEDKGWLLYEESSDALYKSFSLSAEKLLKYITFVLDL